MGALTWGIKRPGGSRSSWRMETWSLSPLGFTTVSRWMRTTWRPWGCLRENRCGRRTTGRLTTLGPVGSTQSFWRRQPSGALGLHTPQPPLWRSGRDSNRKSVVFCLFLRCRIEARWAFLCKIIWSEYALVKVAIEPVCTWQRLWKSGQICLFSRIQDEWSVALCQFVPLQLWPSGFQLPRRSHLAAPSGPDSWTLSRYQAKPCWPYVEEWQWMTGLGREKTLFLQNTGAIWAGVCCGGQAGVLGGHLLDYATFLFKVK